jgi:phosphoadenosine phosphosulfate reductase
MSLREETLFGTVDKVEIALERIRTFEPEEGYWFGDSGGKDSGTVRRLLQMAGVKYDAHHNLTTVDAPETVKFIKNHHPETQIHKPEKSMWQVIRENGSPPTRTMRFCCRELKERGGEGRIIVTGIRWAESNRRAKRQMTEVCMRGKGSTFLHPIIDWTDEDVWNFIRAYNVPYCCLYDEGFKRIGCVMCPFNHGKVMRQHAQRWPKIADAYKRACIRAFEEHKDNPKRNWQSGEQMYEWWISDKSREDDDQTVLFE